MNTNYEESLDSATCWTAVCARNRSYDGRFVCGVKTGELGGYRGGLERKRVLIDHLAEIRRLDAMTGVVEDGVPFFVSDFCSNGSARAKVAATD